jgi:hypothetical protein
MIQVIKIQNYPIGYLMTTLAVRTENVYCFQNFNQIISV